MRKTRFYTSYYTLAIVLGLIGLVLYGCSVKKNKWPNRAYHNTTARFNGYFNGNESWKEGVATLEKNHIDKYDRMLPVFKFGTVEQSKSIYPQMDKAIKKAETVVTKHSMLIKGKQYNNWVDASYLLRGKSRFYKRDYYGAIEDLEYVSNTKPKRKRHIWKYEALIFLARSYSELAMFSESQTIIDRIKNEKEFPKKYQDDFAAVQADFYLKQGDDSSAIMPLRKAIELTKKKSVKARYTYILAQIYQNQQNYKKASMFYAEVLKLSPSFDMAFNAQLNLARSFDSQAGGTSGRIRARLMKMTKEDKNSDYLDQIYYALGELALRENNERQAIVDFNKSVKTSKTNSNQKGLSYMALGNIYLSKPEYRPAKAYYDSSASFVDKEGPMGRLVADRKKYLGDLIKNLDIIVVQDSLQALAKLSPEERDKKINAALDYKAKLEQEAKDKAKADAENGVNDPNSTNNPLLINQQQQSSTTGNFPFTNPALRATGFSDFKRIWGDRPLEDNWRRSNKASVAPTVIEPEKIDSSEIGMDSAAIIKKRRQKDFDAILAALPKNDTDFVRSDSLIIEAHYAAGNIYRESLKDNTASVEILEKLLVRYPKSKYEASIYYTLFRLFGAMGNTAKADYYKGKLFNEYPNSDYAKIIKDPTQLIGEDADRKAANEAYTKAYALYKAENYAQVIIDADAALARFSVKEIRPKFAYLRALAVGRTQDINSFEASLRNVVTNYPTDKVKDEAQYLLDYISKKKSTDSTSLGNNSMVNTGALTMFTMNADTVHYYAVFILNKKVKVNEIKTSLSDFNGEYFSLLDLKIENQFLNSDNQFIMVKSFNTASAATTYFNAIKGDPAALGGMASNDYFQCIITPNNLVVVQKQKDIANYQAYFKDKYKAN